MRLVPGAFSKLFPLPYIVPLRIYRLQGASPEKQEENSIFYDILFPISSSPWAGITTNGPNSNFMAVSPDEVDAK